VNTNEQFTAWASQQGIPAGVVETLVGSAPNKQDLDPEVPYHFSHLEDIMSMNGKDGIPVPAISNGFLMIGCCCNGDPVAVDFQKDVGSVYYLSHEGMFRNKNLRHVAVQVAKDIHELLRRLGDDPDFPLDYWDAAK
jgi:hypothetical protein